MSAKPKAVDLKAAEKALGVELIPNGLATQAVHDAVVAYQANRRQGNHSTKDRSEVARSDKKPWRQKGTGNARHGSASSPIWRGGGVVFGPRPRDYSKKLNKKVRKLALKKAISEAAKSGTLQSVAALDSQEGKTKALRDWLKSSGLEGSLLIITKDVDAPLVRAARNIEKVQVYNAAQVNAEHVLLPRQVVVVEDAFAPLGERLK